MGQLDNTKKAIGVNKIDEKDRQEIFKKFVDAGGQVIKEESKKEDQKGKTSQKSSKSPISRDSREKSRGTSGRSKNSIPEDEKEDIKPAVYEYDYSSFWDRFILKFKSWSAKVSPFGEPLLNPEFMSFLNLELKESLLNFSLASKDILGNPQVYGAMLSELQKLNPLFPELILRGGKLLNYGEMEELFRQYNSSPQSAIRISDVYSPLYSLFRKLYFISQYQMLYKKALEAGYDLLEKYEKKSSVLYKTKKKQFLKNHYFIFEKAFDKIYLAVLRHNNKNIPLYSKYMELFLEVKPDERIGSMRNLVFVDPAVEEKQPPKNEKPEEKEEKSKEEEKEEIEEAPPLLKEGIELLDSLQPEFLRKKYDPKKEFAAVELSDKALLSYLYFKEFDTEYSQVLTSKKIIINSTNHAGLKIDHREKLDSIYELTRNCYEHFENYIENRVEYDKIKSTPLSNYIEQSKKLSAADTKRNTASRSTRSSIREFMAKTVSQLKIFLEDMEKEKLIVGNPDEVLIIDNVDSRKKINKKKIKDAIFLSCAYATAMVDRLSDGSPLYSQGLELNAEEMKSLFGIETLGLSDEEALKKEKKEESTLSDLG